METLNRPRMIPVLLLQDGALVKSIGFKQHRYIGDPINAVRLFNEFEADELILMDISARIQGRCMPLEKVQAIGEEAQMPFGVGGGFDTREQVERAIASGAEKVILNTAAWLNPDLVAACVRNLGSSTISVCMDVRKNWVGKWELKIQNGKVTQPGALTDWARKMQDAGAGELIVQNINRDGTGLGYDLNLIQEIAKAVNIPVVTLGGAAHVSHLWEAYHHGASAMAASSMFIYQGAKKGVLLSYPID